MLPHLLIGKRGEIRGEMGEVARGGEEAVGGGVPFCSRPMEFSAEVSC